jgi:DNA-binding MarR family transcriptional regulator
MHMDMDYSELVELMFKVYAALHSGDFGARKRCDEFGRLDIGTLGYLSHTGRSTISETADKLCVSRPQMSVIADRLVENGLIERTKDEADRRVSWIAITSEGRKALGEAVEATGARIHERLSRLAPEELASMKASLLRLIEVLGDGDK